MARVRLAQRIKDALIADGITHVSWGDGLLVDACGDHVRCGIRHPMNTMDAAIDALERAPDLFIKHHMRGHDSRGRNRVVRMFEIRSSPSPSDEVPE